MPHQIKLGKNTRMSYSKINEVSEMPNLIEVQKNSYEWFLKEGLREVLRDESQKPNYYSNDTGLFDAYLWYYVVIHYY